MTEVTQQVPETINLVNPDGRLVGVSSDQVRNALGNGYRQETDQEYADRWRKEQYGTGVGSELLAAGAGAARGLSFGLSDVLLTRSKLVDPAVLRAYKETNSAASTAGEIGGVAIPALVGGGGGAGGKAGALRKAIGAAGVMPRAAGAVGRVTEEAVAGGLSGFGIKGLGAKLLEKGASKAAAGAVEGTLYGAGQLVSESALGDHDLTAEQVLSHLGISAVLGGTVGGVLGASGVAAEAGAKKLMQVARSKVQDSTLGQKLSDMAAELADESALKATGARGADIRKLGTDAKIRQVGEDLRSYKLQDGQSVLRPGQSQGDFLSRIRTARKEAGEELGTFRKRANEFVRDNPSEAWDLGEYLAQVRKEVLEPLNQSGVPSIRAKAKKIFAELAPAQKAYEKGYQFAPSEFEKLRRDLADVVYPKRPPGGGLPPAPPPHAAELMRAERILADFIEQKTNTVVAKMDPGAVGKYAELKRVSESMIKAEKLADKASKQDLGNRWLSPTDYLTGMGGGVIAGGPLGVVAGLGVAAAHKVIRERGRSVVAAVAGEISKLNALKAASDGVTSRITGAINGFIKSALDAHPSRTVIPAVEQALGGSVSSIAQPKVAQQQGAPKNRKAKPVNYRQRLDEILEAASHPGAQAERISKSIAGFSDEAPNVATKLAAKANTALQFLAAKAPRDTTPPMLLNPLARKWEPSKNDLAKWGRYVDAVEDPTRVLDDLHRGEISHEAVEAMRVVYPKMYEGIRMQLASRVAELRDELPYRQRVQLSILFGAPLDPTLQPKIVERFQTMHSAIAQQAAAARARPTSGGKSAVMDLASPSERLQAGS